MHIWTYVSNCLDLAFPGLDLPRSVASISSYISSKVPTRCWATCELHLKVLARVYALQKGDVDRKPDKIFQTEEEFCDDAGRDSRSGSTQWLGNMQPLWSPGSPPESTKNTRKPRLGVPTCDKKWQFSLGQLDSVKKRYVCWFVSRKVVKFLQLGRWNLALLIFWNLQRLGAAKMGHLELGGWSFDLKQSNSSDFMIAWRSCNVLWPSSTVKWLKMTAGHLGATLMSERNNDKGEKWIQALDVGFLCLTSIC